MRDFEGVDIKEIFKEEEKFQNQQEKEKDTQQVRSQNESGKYEKEITIFLIIAGEE